MTIRDFFHSCLTEKSEERGSRWGLHPVIFLEVPVLTGEEFFMKQQPPSSPAVCTIHVGKYYFLVASHKFPLFFFLLLLLLFFRSSKKEKGSDYIGILKIQSPPGLMCIALLLSSTASRFPILSFIHSFLFYFLFFTFLFSIFNFFFFFSLLLESVLRHAITNKTYTTRPCEDPSMKRD